MKTIATHAGSEGGTHVTPAASDHTTLAARLAGRLCEGFRHHDRRERVASIEAFAAVDRHQFAHLDESRARDAAEAYVDALWEKDAVEDAHRVDGTLDRDRLATAEWDSVERPLARRASVVGMDAAYARLTATAWRRHKTGGDYWTPTLRAQGHEVRAAIGPSGAEKAGDGIEGVGALPARYLVGVELHDMHSAAHWQEAVEVMTPYYAAILAGQEEGQ